MNRRAGHIPRPGRAAWKGHLRAERVLDIRRHHRHHRRLEHAREDGVDADALVHQVARDRQRHASTPALDAV